MRPHDSEGQLGLFAAPTPLFTCTPTKLASFEDCPRRYRFSYLDRPAPRKGPPWAHSSLGVSVHAALKSWFAMPAERRDTAGVGRLLRGGWVRDGYRDDDQEARIFQRALGWLERYTESAVVEADPVGLERVVATKTRRMAFSGRVDRIDQRADGLVIVDYKTGRHPLGEDDARGSRALALYAVAAERVFRQPCRTVELHHIPTGTVVTHQHTGESLDRHVRRAERVADDAVQAEADMAGGMDRDEAFPTTPGPLCSWCDYRRLCPAGADAPTREPWSAVDTL